jgi:hypothetical protein
MFSLPTTESSTENMIDGCPVIDLPDSKEDIASLLQAIYDGCYAPFPKYNASYFSTLSGLLRLSSKYLIDRLRSRVVQHLREEYPSTLAGFDLRAAEDLSKSTHPARVIALARECDVPEILPVLFYDLAFYPPHDEETFELPPAEIRRCIVGRDAIKDKASQFSLARFTLWGRDQCQQKSPSCQERIDEFWPKIVAWHLAGPVKRGQDPLNSARAILNMDPPGPWLCPVCHPQMERKFVQFREMIWNGLPTFFDLL